MAKLSCYCRDDGRTLTKNRNIISFPFPFELYPVITYLYPCLIFFKLHLLSPYFFRLHLTYYLKVLNVHVCSQYVQQKM